ncbi:energy-coupling factor transporter ATPase [Clostridiaceae bacterium JG1575]|nr:energy-coupling factor transporter ATPase [Clostridiaceae bacterium JG1575]
MSIQAEHVTFEYSPGTPFATKALDDVTLTIPTGTFAALIGHTGSGKSTLIQHFNGLIKPTSGRILLDGADIHEKGGSLTAVRRRVGLVFQYPEYQLFEETVEKDVAFGPKNLGLSEEEIRRRVKKAIELVGLDFEAVRERSPFDLSGGQKRRVAIAGVVAMEPRVLILDEPTAGLDPRGRNEILAQLKTLHESYEMTTVLVSHSMEDVADLAELVLVMHRGRVVMQKEPRAVFAQIPFLESMGLAAPQVTYLMAKLREKGFEVPTNLINVAEATDAIEAALKGGGTC